MGFDCILSCRVSRPYPPPHAIQSLQGYPGELARSSGMDITLEDVLAILDEHYNNIKALDALNQELFQLQMGEKETISERGVCLSRHLQVLAASFPECFPPDCVAELKCDWLLWQATKTAQGHGGLPEGQPTEEDVLQLSASHEGSQKGRFYGTLPKPNCQ